MSEDLNRLIEATREHGERAVEAAGARLIHWRDQSAATIKENLAEWEIEPTDDLLVGFLLGAFYGRDTCRQALQRGLSAEGVLHWTTEAMIVAQELLEQSRSRVSAGDLEEM